MQMHADDRLKLLRIASSFLWADHRVDVEEETFFVALARELDLEVHASTLRDGPPAPEDVDPSTLAPALVDEARAVALRAIAADGRVEDEEMELFFLMDALLPEARRVHVEASPNDDGEIDRDPAVPRPLHRAPDPIAETTEDDAHAWERYCA